MKSTLMASIVATTLATAPLSAHSSSWDFAEDPTLTKQQKQQKFEERKAAVIQRMEQGKKRMMERINKRIECAQNAKTPKNMRACHKTYSINANKVEKEHFQD